MKIKFQKLLSLVLTFILTFGIYSVAFATDDIPEGYTPVYTAEDLDNIRNNLSGKYILMNDIDLSSFESWVPIGNDITPFTGILNANNYTISKMNIKKEAKYVGLLGCIDSAEIRNITIENANIKINTDKSIFAGLLSGQSSNSIILNCKSSGTINIESKDSVNAGGIVGVIWNNSSNENDSYISSCSNSVDIDVVGQENDGGKIKDLYAGGIAGSSNSSILQCSNYGNIDICNNDTKAIFVDVSAGGICGYTRGNIKDCYNIGSIESVGTDSAFAGGIAGYWQSYNSISNLYNIGAVNSLATEENALEFYGALIGYEDGSVNIGTDLEDQNILLSNCYYMDNNLAANGFLGSCSVVNVEMLTKDDFKDQSSFIGFDFENIWEISEKEERPILRIKTTDDSIDNQFLAWIFGIWKSVFNFFKSVIKYFQVLLIFDH